MPESCIVCKERGGISFKVPRDELLLHDWMEALRMDKLPRVGSRVCFRHFKYEDIYKMKNSHKLVKGALPNLRNNYEDSSQNDHGFFPQLDQDIKIHSEGLNDSEGNLKSEQKNIVNNGNNVNNAKTYSHQSHFENPIQSNNEKPTQSNFEKPTQNKSAIYQYLAKKESNTTSDVLIHCSDGFYSSHRIVLASVSKMLCKAMKDMTFEDDLLVIVVPDFSVLDFSNFFNDVFERNNLASHKALMAYLCVDKLDVKPVKTEFTDYGNPFDHLKVMLDVKEEPSAPMDDTLRHYSEKISFRDMTKLAKVKKVRCLKPKAVALNHAKRDPENKKNLLCCYCEKSIHSHRIYDHLAEHHQIHVEFSSKKRANGVTQLESVRAKYLIQDPENPRLWYCNVDNCRKPFFGNGNLGRHLKKQHQISISEYYDKEYLCTFCGKSFDRNENRKNHEKVHSEGPRTHPPKEKRHQCTVCGKKLLSPAALEVHMRSHTGEKPYICSECGSRFRYLKSYKVHVATHEPGYVKPQKSQDKETVKQKCDLCGKDVVNISGHRATFHSDVDLQCQFCDFKTKYHQNMRAHVKRVHDQLPLKEICTLCGKETIDLAAHMNYFH